MIFDIETSSYPFTGWRTSPGSWHKHNDKNMTTDKLTKTEGEILNTVRKFIVKLGGKSGKTFAKFCKGSHDCEKCDHGYCTFFFNGSLLQTVFWNKTFLMSFLAGEAKLVVTTGTYNDDTRNHTNKCSAFIDFNNRECWFFGDENQAFAQSVEKNVKFLFEELDKFHYKERGRIYSKDFGI